MSFKFGTSPKIETRHYRALFDYSIRYNGTTWNELNKILDTFDNDKFKVLKMLSLCNINSEDELLNRLPNIRSLGKLGVERIIAFIK